MVDGRLALRERVPSAFKTFVRSLASRYATMRSLICRRSWPVLARSSCARCANDFIRVIVLRLGVGSLVSSALWRRPWPSCCCVLVTECLLL